MMKRKIFFLIACALVIIVLLCLLCNASCTNGDTEEKHDAVDTTCVLVSRIKECSKLYTAEIQMHKIVTHDDQLKLKSTILSKSVDLNLPFGERKVAIPIDATVKAYVDLGDFSDKNVEITGERIEIFLPEPKIVLTQSKVRNEDIRKHVPLLRSNFSDEELSAYAEEGRKSIVESIPSTGLVEMAREGAANVLIPLLEQMGYREENIVVTFRKDFTVSDIRRMLVND